PRSPLARSRGGRLRRPPWGLYRLTRCGGLPVSPTAPLPAVRLRRRPLGEPPGSPLPPPRPRSRGDLRAEEVDDLAGRSSGREHGGDAPPLQLLRVRVRDRPADDDQHVLGSVLAQPVEDPRDE